MKVSFFYLTYLIRPFSVPALFLLIKLLNKHLNAFNYLNKHKILILKANHMHLFDKNTIGFS